MCSRIDMQTHAGLLGLGFLPLIFRPQGQCIPRSCHRLYLYRLVLTAQAVFLLERGQTDRQTNRKTNRQT